MTSLSDYFWGERNNGFDVLYHNMKYGQLSSKEFTDFLRESCSVEETYAKLLCKLAKIASNSLTSNGSFTPFWHVIRTLAEKLSSIHLQLVHSWQDLIKDVQRYNDEQHKKHKSIKDNEAGTLEVVQSIQHTTAALHKAKENYHARCLEYEKLKRENSTQKELEKAEVKYKKASDEYRVLVDKYANVRNEFETKMTESCKHFQEAEEHHLQQMKDFVDTYAKSWEHQHAMLGQVHAEFCASSNALTVMTLVEKLIQAKSTGKTKPGPIEFEEPDLSSLPPAQPQVSPDLADKKDSSSDKPKKEESTEQRHLLYFQHEVASPQASPEPGKMALERSPNIRASKWFLGKSRKKDKKKKKKKDKDAESQGSSELDVKTPQVDDEGYSIPPANRLDNDRNSWYSSSDSDSDGDERQKKIKVEIKPLNSPSSSGNSNADNVDDIRKSIEVLRLSPTTVKRGATPTLDMKRSTSLSDATNGSAAKPSQDLLGLDLFAMSSSASTPSGASYPFPSPSNNSTSTSAATTPMSTSRSQTPTPSNRSQTPIFSNALDVTSPDTPPSLPPRSRGGNATSSTTPTGAPLLPGPPPSRAVSRSKLPTQTARPSGRQSPAPNKMDRNDSFDSVNSIRFNTTSMPTGSSRGPSPLTIGMSDTVPLAVAFSETVNAYFKGTDDTNVKVKVTGDMMVSFPAGIVRVLLDNPSPATLSFKVKNASRLEQVLLNKQLVLQDMSQSTADGLVYQFDMNALTDHLKRQAETNKTASYFNIDILKYQVKTSQCSSSTPLQAVTYWKCEPTQTDFRLDYSYNNSCLPASTPLTNVTVIVPVDGEVTNMQSQPNATWNADSKRVVWKLSDISDMREDGGKGCLRAKFDVSDGPTKPSMAAFQFIGDGTTTSGIDFELIGVGYRLSLIKKRFVSGKYVSETDLDVSAPISSPETE